MAATKSRQRSMPPAVRTRLSQTRRHSWFGSSLETQEGNIVEQSETIYDIKEEKGEECPAPQVSQPWWSLNSWKKGESPEKSEVQDLKKKNLETKDNKKNSMGHESENTAFTNDFVGLRCRKNNDKNQLVTDACNGIEHKPVLAKRIGGLGLDKEDAKSQAKVKEGNFKGSNSENAADHPTMPSLAARQQPPSLNSHQSRSVQRRATVHYSSTGRPSVMDFRRRTAHCSLRANEVRALEQIKDICRDYVVYRLKQRNLVNRVTIERPQSKEKWLFQEILFIQNELERLYKCRFSDISKQIGITLRSEDVLRKVFFELSGEILTTETKPHHSNEIERNGMETKRNGTRPRLLSLGSRHIEITWGRIFAVLAITGGLAVDCVQQGHADLVNYLIEYIGEFARVEGILPWITDQGGWEVLGDLTYETSARTVTADPCYFAKLTNIALAFVVCTLGAVIGAVTFGSLINKDND